jgi:hypothetical protein
MAYTDRDSTGTRDSHGWAIAGAFAGQAAIIVGIGALLAVGTTSASTQMSAWPAPLAAAPRPAFIAAPDVQPLNDFPYQVAMDGQHGGDVFPDASSMPAFTVKPGQDLTVSLDVTVPATQSITDLSVSLLGLTQDAGRSDIQSPYNDSVQSQAPGTHVFLLSWPGSASELRPGTQWMLFMSAGAPNGRVSSPIAQITVAP